MEIMLTGLLPEALVIDQPEVDAQHEQIFVRIETLKIAFSDGVTPTIEVFDDLLAFFAHHFATEEHIARQAGLEFSQHTKKHNDNLYILGRALDEVRRGSNDVYSFLRYVEYWFERHIIEEDKPFGARLKGLHQGG